MGVKEIEIENYLRELGIEPVPHASITAVSMPTIVNLLLWGPMANVFDMKYHILHCNKEGIIAIALDNITGKLTKSYMLITWNTITQIHIKSVFMGYKLTIQTEQGRLKYRINKRILGQKWQTENLNNVLQWIRESTKGVLA